MPLLRAVGDRGGEAATLNNIGAVYDDLGEKQRALEYYEQALPLLRAVGDRRGEATTLNNIGEVYSALGEKQRALEYYEQALPLLRAVGDRGGEAATLNNIGGVYDALGEKQRALEYFEQALPLLRAVGDRSGEAGTLNNAARVKAGQGDLTAALADMQAAIDLLEQLRLAAPAGDLRQTYFASIQGYYRFYLDLLMDLHQQHPERGYDAQALAASESARARTLLDLLSEAGADIRQGVPAPLLQREQALRQRLSALEKQRLELANNEATASQAQPLQAEIDQLLQQQRQLESEIRAASPAYAALQYPQPLTAQQIQQQVLDPDTLLLQYSLGDEQSYLWAVTPDSLQVHLLPGRAELTEAIQQFRRATTSRSNPERAQTAANDLSQLLLGPVADQLPGKRLLIVPDGALHFVSFAALSDPHQPSAPLVANHELVSAPAASVLAIQRQALSQRAPAPKALALLADPVFTADDPRLPAGVRQPDRQAISGAPVDLPRALRALDLSRLSRLPGTRAEAEQILALFPSAQTLSALDFEANYDFATAPDLSQYRIVHLATHGFFNGDNPELSGIVLSLFEASGQPQPNGFLTLNDIFNLKLPAELVVLSACQTAEGKAVGGEGLVGLTRGLMYAGAERAVVSLWSVDDAATAALMSAFYRGILQENLAPAAALRQAQQEIRQQQGWEHPYYWAAFTLQGEWRP